MAAIQFTGNGSAQLCFSHTGRASEQQRCHRSILIPNTAATATHRLCHRCNRLFLPHDLLRKNRFQIQKPLPFIGSQPAHRDPRSG